LTPRTTLACALVLLLAGCAGPHVAPIGAEGQPFRLTPEERALWAQADREERTLAEKTREFKDPPLEQYLAKIGDRLLPDSVREAGGPALSFDVLRDPTLNAFAMPNGHLYVHTGLLAALDNEAQLAMILAREIMHVRDRHALSQRGRRHTPIAYTIADIEASISAAVAADTTARSGYPVGPAVASTGVPTLYTGGAAVFIGVPMSSSVAVAAGARARSGEPPDAAMLSPVANVVLGLDLEVAAVASIDGYGRKLEREADAAGMGAMVNAGYDPKEAPKLFERLRQEAAEGGVLETFFLGNVARLDERITVTRQLVATTYARAAASPSTVKDGDEFHLRMLSVVRENAHEDIRAGRFKRAGRELDRVLAATPQDAVAHLYAGELHRLQAQRARTATDKESQTKLALASYERSIELDRAMPEPYRELGLLYYQQQEPAKAREAFTKYLALSPNAPDAPRVSAYIVELDR